MKNIDDCHKDFLNFKSDFESYKNQDLTESDTRSKIIDVIFTQILDWDEKSIDREGYVEEGYYDYLFSIPNFKFIVEAKREFKVFNLPAKHKGLNIGILEKTNKEEIEQIRRYLFNEGLSYAVLTNGHQFIIGKFVNSDGSDWKSNKCLIFNGFDDIENRFTEFYNILSKTIVSDNTGFGVFLNESFRKEGKIILSALPEKDAELIRNTLSSELTPIINELFGELGRISENVNNELMKKCFIENQETKKNRSDIEKLFADNPPKLERVLPVQNTKNTATQIKKEIVADDFNETPPNPIVIIGSKGAGKTTFINYLFSNYQEQSHPYIYIDFINYSDLQGNFTNRIYSDILEQIYEKYNQVELTNINTLRSIYRKEIKRNDNGIWKYNYDNDRNEYEKVLSHFLSEKLKDAEAHFFQLSEHMIKSRKTRLCIVIDNADQFDIETQKKVFLLAQSINKKGNVIIILSLREGYYHKLRCTPPFDAFAYNVYHITAPPYGEVLQKRIDYALAKIEALKGKISGPVGNKKFTMPNDNVRIFLLGLKSTLFGDHNSEILNFIQETTYPNIRDGLGIFKQFLTSGHTKVSEYILRYRNDYDSHRSKITIPFWEFIKAVGLDNRRYYKHDISTINNLFYPVKGSNNHFLKIRILRFLDNKLVEGGETGKDHNVEGIVSEFINTGYSRKHIIGELEELCQWRMIETNLQTSDTENSKSIDMDGSISISMKGHHYINSLLTQFIYLDMVVGDTPIFSDDFFDNIKTVFPISDSGGKRSLKGRVDTVGKFIDYLGREEASEVSGHHISVENVIRTIKCGVDDDIERINRKLTNVHSI